jgi:hypothetical protein
MAADRLLKSARTTSEACMHTRSRCSVGANPSLMGILRLWRRLTARSPPLPSPASQRVQVRAMPSQGASAVCVRSLSTSLNRLLIARDTMSPCLCSCSGEGGFHFRAPWRWSLRQLPWLQRKGCLLPAVRALGALVQPRGEINRPCPRYVSGPGEREQAKPTVSSGPVPRLDEV